MDPDGRTNPSGIEDGPSPAPLVELTWPAGEGPLATPRRAAVVVVPAYNEVQRIAEVVAGLRQLEPDLAELGLELRVYVVDDGSTDGTRHAAREAGAQRVLRHRTNLGLGAAVRTGLLAARNDGAAVAIKFDADLQHDPRDVLALVRPIVDDEAEVVYGDRSGRIEYPMPWLRRSGNLCFTMLMRWLTGWPLRDSQPGILALARVYLDQFFLPGDYNYTQQILLDAYHRGMRFAHAPVRFRSRETGRSFISLRYPYKVLGQIVLVLIGVRPMRIFAPIGLLCVGLAAAVSAWQVSEWLAGEAIKPVRNVNFVLGVGLFGLQTFFFGLLAELIVRLNRRH